MAGSSQSSLDKIVGFLTHAATIWAMFIALISGIVGVYVAYSNFLNSININQKEIEKTQIMILKRLVRNAEKNPCPVSDPEWDEYLLNKSTLHDLKKKHKLITADLPFRPILRIRERTDACKE